MTQLGASRAIGASWLNANVVTIQKALDDCELQEITL
jgi:hypothetical protein